MTRYRSDEDIEDLALWVREKVGVGRLLAPDVFELLKRFDPVIPGFRWSTLPDELLPFDEAFANRAEKSVTFRQSVCDAAGRGDPRSRMTVAHELAHLVLNHPGYRFRSTGKDRRSAQLPRVKAEETEAKRLAGAILAPAELVSKCQSIQEISELFQITEAAAEVRKDTADRIARRRAGIQRQLPAVVLDFLSESKKRGHPVKSIPSNPPANRSEALTDKRTESQLQGYQSDSCSECTRPTLKRDGAGFVCDTCGSTSGCSCAY